MKSFPIFALIIFSIIILSSSTSLAITQNFAVYTQKGSLELCFCEITKDSFTIFNTGTAGNWYKIETESGFVELSSNLAYADSGRSAEVIYTISIPCKTKKEETIKFKITSLDGYQRIFEKRLTINNCQNLKTALAVSQEILDKDSTIKPCETVKYTLYVQNTGPFEEEYTYEIKGKKLASENTFTLKPFELRNITLEYTPDCAIYGKHPFTITVRTTGTGRTASMTHELNIEQDYGFTIFFEHDEIHTFCKETSSVLFFAVKNNVNVSNNYTLHLTGPSFVRLGESQIFLEGMEEKHIALEIGPSGQKGEFQADISAKSYIGNAYAQASARFKKASCYDISLSSDTSQIKSCDDKNTQTIRIRNNADVYQELALKIDGVPEFATLSQELIALGPGEESEFELEIENPRTDFSYYIWVKAYLDDWELGAIPLKYSSISGYSCTLLETQKKDLAINYQTKEKQLQIYNKGLQYETYSIIIKGPEWVDLKETQISLASKESKRITLDIFSHEEIPEGKYKIYLIFFSETTGQKYEYSLNIILKDKTWIVKSFETVVRFFNFSPATTTMFYLIIAFMLILLVLIIVKVTAPKYPYKASARIKSKQSLLILLIAVFLVSIALVFGLGGLPYIPTAKSYVPEAEEPNVIQWAEDTKYYFNISEHVIDPEGDFLEYSIHGNNKIIAKIEGEMAVFEPPKNWFGEETITFTATDIFGQSTTSKPIILRVIDIPEFSFWDYAKPWLWVLNLLIFGLILAVFFLIFIVHNRRKKKAKQTKKAQ